MKAEKMISILLLVTILLTACGKQGKGKKSNLRKSDREELFIKGDVKSVRITTHEAVESFGEIEKKKFISDILEVYNEDGFKKEYYEFDSSGKIDHKRWSENGGFISKGETYLETGEVYQRLLIDVDAHGNNVVGSFQSNKGKLLEKQIRDYDINDNLLQVTVYSSDGSVLEKTLNSYNSNGKLIENSKVDGTGKQMIRWEHDYRNLTKFPNLNNDYYRSTEYDSADDVVCCRYYQYNDEGMITEIKVDNYTSPAVTFTYEYTYDKNKNWTTRVTRRNGVATEISERQYNVIVPKDAYRTIETAPPIISASSSSDSNPEYNVMDDDESTSWSPSGYEQNPYLKFEFRVPKDISKIEIIPTIDDDDTPWDSYSRIKTCTIESSTTSEIQTLNFPDEQKLLVIPMNLKAAKWVKISFTDNHYSDAWSTRISISEVSLH